MSLREEIILVLLDKLAIALLILIAGYFLNKLIERFKAEQSLRKQYESLRDETKLTHIQRQIEELYSPLHALQTTSRIVYDIANQKRAGMRGQSRTDVSKEEAEIWRYFVEKYFLPFNKQMADLIRSKVHLMETEELPNSFNRFLEHQAQYDCLHSLWRDKEIPSDEIYGTGWPEQFGGDVQRTLTDLRRRYREYLERVEKTA